MVAVSQTNPSQNKGLNPNNEGVPYDITCFKLVYLLLFGTLIGCLSFLYCLIGSIVLFFPVALRSYFELWKFYLECSDPDDCCLSITTRFVFFIPFLVVNCLLVVVLVVAFIVINIGVLFYSSWNSASRCNAIGETEAISAQFLMINDGFDLAWKFVTKGRK